MESWFVGRREQIAQFDRSLERAQDRRLSVLAFVGEAGLGKSSLMDTIAERATAAGSIV